MSDIKFACPQCQQHIQCEAGYGGMEVACPTCSTPIIVPTPTPAPTAVFASAPPPPAPSRMTTSAPAATASSGCPSCGVALPRGAVLCTRCGYNLATGQRTVAGRPAPRGRTTAPSGDTVWYKTMYPYFGLFAVTMLVLYLLGRSNPLMMAVFFGLAGLYMLAIWIITAIYAFKDGMLKGFLCLCIGIYAIYWVYKESDNNFLKLAYALLLVLYLILFAAGKAQEYGQ